MSDSNALEIRIEGLDEGVKIKVQLIGFCDASGKGLHAMCIFQSKTTDESVSTKLVTTKTKAKPLTQQTVPRFELLSTLFLARLIKHVTQMFCTNHPNQIGILYE